MRRPEAFRETCPPAARERGAHETADQNVFDCTKTWPNVPVLFKKKCARFVQGVLVQLWGRSLRSPLSARQDGTRNLAYNSVPVTTQGGQNVLQRLEQVHIRLHLPGGRVREGGVGVDDVRRWSLPTR